jgi:aspartokinase-like uncharacterized kinase
MTAYPPAVDGITVVKIGGGLTAIPHALDRVCAAVGKASRQHRLVVVPGGGPFADAVREFDRAVGLSAGAAHWMAILAMDQYAHVIADRMSEAVVVEEPGGVSEVVSGGQVAVIAPSRWMRSVDVLPHTWDLTSDSIAAFIAGALGAARLVLIKPAGSGDRVDSYFTTALPSDLPYTIVSWDRIEELWSQLSG